MASSSAPRRDPWSLEDIQSEQRIIDKEVMLECSDEDDNQTAEANVEGIETFSHLDPLIIQLKKNLSTQRKIYLADIVLKNFGERLKILYSHWEEQRIDLWSSADVLSIAMSERPKDKKPCYLKSSALTTWLFGLVPWRSVIVFTKKQIYCLCSSKEEASLFEIVQKPAKEAVGVDVVLYVKAESDTLDAIASTFHVNAVVGHIEDEVPTGHLPKSWSKKLKRRKFQLADVTDGLSHLFAVKDNDEIEKVKKSASFAADVMKEFVIKELLEKVINMEKEVLHSTLSEETSKAILKPSKTCLNYGDEFDIAYLPIFQSGGNFDFSPSASSSEMFLNYDSPSVIICSVGTRFKNYCSVVARTLLIDAIPLQKKAYTVLLKAHEAAISELNPGNKVSDAYQAALSVVEKEAPELVDKLTKHAGSGIGLELHESGWKLNGKNDKVMKEGMVFNVSLGFQNLQSNPRTQKFSLLLADTVIVKSVKPEVVTANCCKTIEQIEYSFVDVSEEEKQPEVIVIDD